ncbi:MAG: glycoside hydrolase family 2 protein, partial [Tepidisphaeraceae bacterium]
MLRVSCTVVAAWLALSGLSATPTSAADHLTFLRTFAPQQGLVPPVEKPQRDEIVLNGLWQFQPVAVPASFKPNVGQPPVLTPPQANAWDSTPIRIPSPWNVNAFPYGGKGFGKGGDFRCFPSYPSTWENASMGWLRRSFDVPAAWQGDRIILHFEAVAGAADVLVNGKSVGSNFELFLPFELDVTDAVKPGRSNELLVGIRRAMLFDKNSPYGKREYVAGSMWGESIVGIWQDVYLEKRPAVHVSDTLVQSLVDKDQLRVDVTLQNDSPTRQHLAINADVRPWVNNAGADLLSAPEPKSSLGNVALSLPKQEIDLAPGESKTVSLQTTVDTPVDQKLKLWSPDQPNLYTAVVNVEGAGGLIDRKSTRFGYRQYTLTNHSLQLNGKDIVCKGDAWHFTGVPQMTRRYAYTWFKAIKEANGNCVRLHAQPYPRFYLDVADELGLLVLDETAIWGSGGTPRFDLPSYWQNADQHLLKMVRRDRNHASVMGYSVTNEMLVLMRNRRLPLEPAYKYYAKWVNDIHTLDPTHPWISGDGEEDAGGTLPTVIGHYGGFDA